MEFFITIPNKSFPRCVHCAGGHERSRRFERVDVGSIHGYRTIDAKSTICRCTDLFLPFTFNSQAINGAEIATAIYLKLLTNETSNLARSHAPRLCFKMNAFWAPKTRKLRGLHLAPLLPARELPRKALTKNDPVFGAQSTRFKWIRCYCESGRWPPEEITRRKRTVAERTPTALASGNEGYERGGGQRSV